MMNLNYLSTSTIICIARGASHLEQKQTFEIDGTCRTYCVKVSYPNGYGASIVGYPEDGYVEYWNVYPLKDGNDLPEDDNEDYMFLTSEEDIIRICDNIYFR